MRGARRGDHRVGPHQQQGADVGAQGVQQLVGAAARPRQRVRVHAPHARHVTARLRVVQLAVAGQLVGLLAVFTPALAVALAGEAAVAGVRAAGAAGGQAEVDPRADRVGALGLLLRAARGEHHRRLGIAEHPHRLAQLRHRHAGDPLHVLRPVRHRRGPGLLPAGGPLRDVRLVGPPLGDHQVQQAERQGEIGARAGRQVQVGLLGGAGAARVDHDQRAAVVAQFGEVAQRRRHGLGRVGADQDHAPGARDVLQRERQAAVHAERLRPGGRGGGHAEPAVVVDLRGAERHPGELAQRVRLLVGEAAAAEDAQRVRAVLGAGAQQGAGDPVQGLVPARRRQLAVGAAHQRLGQPRRALQHRRSGAALAAQRAPVHREVRALQNLDAAPLGGGQVHAALQGAVRAVGGRGRGGVLHTDQRARELLRGPSPPVTRPGR